jgi:uncharacterized protein YjbI with pentapeptide repeats
MSKIQLNDCEHVINASDANLASSRFEDVRLADCEFVQVTLENSHFRDVYLDACAFEKTSFAGVCIRNSLYTGMTIEGIEVDALLEAYRAAKQIDVCSNRAGHENRDE